MPYRFNKHDGKWYSYTGDYENIEQLTDRQAAQMTTAQETGPGEAFLVGAGHRLTQAANKFGADLPTTDMSALREENPISTTFGEAAPYVATAGLGGASLPGQMIMGGLSGFSFAEPGQGIRDALFEGAASGAGVLVGRLIRNLWRARRIPASKAAQDILDTGGKVSPGMRVGKPIEANVLLRKEGAMKAGAYGGDKLDEIYFHNQMNTGQKITDAVLGTGQLSGPLDDDAIKFATKELRARLSTVGDAMGDAKRVPVNLIDDVTREIKNTTGLNRALDLPDNFKWNYVNDQGVLKTRKDIVLDGKQFVRMRELMTERLGEANARVDKIDLAKTLENIDQIILKHAGPDMSKFYKSTRERYEILKTMERVLSAEGTVSKKQPFKALKKQLGERLIDDTTALNSETKVLMQNLRGIASPSTDLPRGSFTAPFNRASKILDKDEAISGLYQRAYMGTQDSKMFNVPGAALQGYGKGSRPVEILSGGLGQGAGRGLLEYLYE